MGTTEDDLLVSGLQVKDGKRLTTLNTQGIANMRDERVSVEEVWGSCHESHSTHGLQTEAPAASASL